MLNDELDKRLELLEKKVDNLVEIKRLLTELVKIQELQDKQNEEFMMIYEQQIEISQKNHTSLKNIDNNLNLLNNKFDNFLHKLGDKFLHK